MIRKETFSSFLLPSAPPALPPATSRHVDISVPAISRRQISADPHYILLSEAKAGRVNELEALILARPDPTFNVNLALDSSFMSPLCLACAGGHRDAATFLLQKANADPNNKAGAAAAAADASQGHPRDPNGDRLLCHGSMAGAGNYDSTPPAPLMLAVEAGLEDVVVDLLARGARVDARRAGDGWTALHLCAAQGHALIMRTLLSAPLADPGVRTTQLETPLTVACSKGHLAIADMLLGEGGDETTVGKKESEETGGQTALGKRTVRGTTSSDVGSAAKNSRGTRRHAEERTWAGRTPLHYAAAEGHTEVVLRLLAHGVSANLVDAQGATPLILAARRGHSATVAVLVVDGRATLNATTMEGDTALHAAAGTSADGASAAVRLLLRNGADVDARNAFGSTGEQRRWLVASLRDEQKMRAAKGSVFVPAVYARYASYFGLARTRTKRARSDVHFLELRAVELARAGDVLVHVEHLNVRV